MLAFFTPNLPPSQSAYTFSGKETYYNDFRPQWPSTFALASLQHVGLRYYRHRRVWFGPTGQHEPVVLIIGSGTGADVAAFLELNCRVYAVEPNDRFREIASHRFASYGDKFVSINGNAHALNLPMGMKVDLIVCAQALHTFRSEILHVTQSEERARKAWRRFLPNDDKDRVAIWYYNLDPKNRAMIELDRRLRKVSLRYAATQTPFLNAPLFEPTEFQYYIEAPSLSISGAKVVASLLLTKESLIRWLMSYSFGPKEDEDEKDAVIESLSAWFERYKNKDGHVTLPYVGFIAQGPLRRTEFSYKKGSDFHIQSSPIFLNRVGRASLFSTSQKHHPPHYATPTQSSIAKNKGVWASMDKEKPSPKGESSKRTLSYHGLLDMDIRHLSSTISSRAKQTEKYIPVSRRP